MAPRRLLRLSVRILGTLGLLSLALWGALWASACETLGAVASGARRDRVEASSQWRDGRFQNRLARRDGPADEMTKQWLFGGQPHREPDAVLPIESRKGRDFATPPSSGLRVTWLGHSTLLLEIDGQRLLLDPVWGERASPFSWAGPKRFFAAPLPLSELPAVDAVVISHDHYDHLDAPTVRALSSRKVRWLVPLGIGAHLERWGVAAEQIVELDWWEEVALGALTVTATPARHFSGRWIDDADQTLWAGWSFAGPTHRAFYSGDTALFPELKDIGERLGPFDLTMIEVGAYDALWADVHLGPEQAVWAHRLVRGDVLLPVHWGLFDLALHGWTEPMERTLIAAEREQVRLLAPRPGQMLEPARDGRLSRDVQRWWPKLPWRTAKEAPALSSGIDALLASLAKGAASP